ncbi:MAG TPA: DUF924 family protein [Rubrobacter sp.]|nr:DUF924 family protein [Rubrobacter sp.]
MSREGGSGIPPERQEVEGEISEAEEVLSYWFPEDLADADMETLRRHGSVERIFFWLPLGHFEEIALHERSVKHAEEEAANAPPHLRVMAEFVISQARAARSVIARFGRHAHRNQILGRTSTPEELEYLRTETPPRLRQPPSL